MKPLLALMRRYCIDYTYVHDLSVCDELMAEDYVVRSSGWELDLEEYKAAVRRVYRRFPTLGITVHEIVTNGRRLVLRFSEHGAVAGDGGATAAWQGIALYDWNGEQLTECLVEQDFASRDRQLEEEHADPLEQPHPDPWVAGYEESSDDVEQVARDWLASMDDDWIGRAGVIVDDAAVDGTPRAVLAAPRTRVDDLFSAGDRAGFRIVLEGRYRGGLPDVSESLRGREVHLDAVGLARVVDADVAEIRIVRDRWGLRRRLLKPDRDTDRDEDGS